MSDLASHESVARIPRHDPSDSRTKAWGLTAILVALYTVNYGDKVVLGLAAQPLREEFGFTASQIGLAGSIFFLALTMSGFLTGVVTRWGSMKWILAALAVIWALCMLPMIIAASLAVLIVSRFLLGLFEGPSSALIHTATYSWHPVQKRSLPGAFIMSAASISKIVVAPALGWVIVHHGWRAAFVAMSLASAMWCVIWLVSWSPGPYGAEHDATDDMPEGHASASSIRWTTLVKTPTFLGAALAVFSFYTLTSVILTWLPSYFEKGLGYSRLEANTMFGIPSMVALVAMFATSFAGDRLMARGVSSRIHRGLVPGFGLLICGLAMVSLPYIGTPVLVVVMVSLGYGLGTIVFPLFNAAISEICPRDKLAGTLGIFLAFMTSGGLIGPYLAGKIVDSAATPAQGYATAFQLIGILALLGAVIALVFVNPQRDAKKIQALEQLQRS
jgi:sugar phosphate permease